MDLDKYYEFMKTRINKTLILREKHGQISGNFGLLDLTEFSVGKNIKEVLDYRLNSKVYNKEDKTGFDIPVEPGK